MGTKVTAQDVKKAKKNADHIKKLIVKAIYKKNSKTVHLTFKDKDIAALFKLLTGDGFSIGRTVSFELTNDMSAEEIASLMRFVTEVK